jgi:hypothetical protein
VQPHRIGEGPVETIAATIRKHSGYMPARREELVLR